MPPRSGNPGSLSSYFGLCHSLLAPSRRRLVETGAEELRAPQLTSPLAGVWRGCEASWSRNPSLCCLDVSWQPQLAGAWQAAEEPDGHEHSARCGHPLVCCCRGVSEHGERKMFTPWSAKVPDWLPVPSVTPVLYKQDTGRILF